MNVSNFDGIFEKVTLMVFIRLKDLHCNIIPVCHHIFPIHFKESLHCYKDVLFAWLGTSMSHYQPLSILNTVARLKESEIKNIYIFHCSCNFWYIS